MKWIHTLTLDRDIQLLAALVIAIKVVVIITIVAANATLPFCGECYDANFIYQPEQAVTLATSFATWDTQHYVYIAEHLYQPKHISNAFFPLYPVLIKVTDAVLPGGVVLAAWIVSAITSLGAVVLLFHFVRWWKNRIVAWKTVGLFLAFPTALYMHIAYNEGLFLLLAIGALYAAYRVRGLWLITLSAALVWVRPQGILVIPAIAWQLLQQRCTGQSQRLLRAFPTALLVAAVSFGGYLIFMYFRTGDALAFINAASQFDSQNSLQYLVHPIEWIKLNWINVDWSWHNVNTSIVNRLFFIGFVVTLYYIWKKLDSTHFIYALSVGLVPALTGDLVSYPRYVLLVFPIFIMGALLIKSRYVLWTIIVFSGILQLLGILFHSQNYFVA